MAFDVPTVMRLEPRYRYACAEDATVGSCAGTTMDVEFMEVEAAKDKKSSH